MTRSAGRRGAVLVVALVTLLVVMLMAGVLIRSFSLAQRQLRTRHAELQAEWLAESAVARAVAELARQPSYQGETWTVDLSEAAAADPESAGVAEIHIESVANQTKQVRIRVDARYPRHDWRGVLVQREYVVAVR